MLKIHYGPVHPAQTVLYILFTIGWGGAGPATLEYFSNATAHCCGIKSTVSSSYSHTGVVSCYFNLSPHVSAALVPQPVDAQSSTGEMLPWNSMVFSKYATAS